MAFIDLHYFSDAIGMQTSAYVLLPQGVAPPYHVMFLLHGRSDDHSIWMRRTSIERYVEGLPLMVVMPNGHRGFYVDNANGFAYGRAITEELPALIQGWFQTHPRWCVSGLSMGGYGAVRCALTRPELFVSAVSHSGALLKFGLGISEERAHEEPEWRRIFGNDPVLGPGDIYHLAAEKRNQVAMRLDCGTEDFLLNENRWYHEFLTNIDFEHEYVEHPGTHEWGYWDAHVREGIEFHRRNLHF